MGISLLGEYDNAVTAGTPVPISVVRAASKDSVLTLFRYVFEDLLGWSPEKIRSMVSIKILKFLKLDVFLSKLPCPSELVEKRDYFYIAESMYPDVFKIRTEERVMYTYKRFQDGEIQKLPKNFFSTIQAPEIACTCLRMAITKDIDASSPYDLYMLFSNKTWAKEFLRKASLLRPCENLYKEPLAYLHDALPMEERSEAIYRFVIFKRDWRKLKGCPSGTMEQVHIKDTAFGKLPGLDELKQSIATAEGMPDSGISGTYKMFLSGCRKILGKEVQDAADT